MWPMLFLDHAVELSVDRCEFQVHRNQKKTSTQHDIIDKRKSFQLAFIHRQKELRERFQVHRNFSGKRSEIPQPIKSDLDRFCFVSTSCASSSYEFIESRRRREIETFSSALDPIEIHKFPAIK
jgi:hypothetical protein